MDLALNNLQGYAIKPNKPNQTKPDYTILMYTTSIIYLIFTDLLLRFSISDDILLIITKYLKHICLKKIISALNGHTILDMP